MRRWIAACVIISALFGCRRTHHRLPSSSAKVGEVLVVGDSNGQLSNFLSQPEPGLPQPEPRFDVRRLSNSQFKGSALLARAIVILGDKSYASGTDLNARPQIVIEASVKDSLRVLRDLEAFEEKNAYAFLRRHGNPMMEEKVRRQFGVRMVVPEEMRASKASKDFLWMATTGAENLRSLCVFRMPYASKGGAVEEINRCLSQNIHGETPSSPMQIVMETVKCGKEQGLDVLTGLWNMENDAMGGPFVASVKPMRHGSIVLLAFAYAPEREKRNIMRQLRAVVCNDHIIYGEQ